MTSHSRRAFLLGAYPGNTHISINNYFDYCRDSIGGYLPEWELCPMRPGRFEEEHFLKADVARRQAWKELYIDWPRQLRKLEGDVFHIVDQGLAWYRLCLPRAGKTIVTVHDLINVKNMRGRTSFEVLPWRRQQMVKLSVSQIRSSDAVICPSSATAADVTRELQIPSTRLHVIYNLIPSVFRPVSEAARLVARKECYGDASYAILHVGKPTAYKNRIGALKIFERIHRELPDSKLVLTSQGLIAEEEQFLRGRPCAAAVEVRQPAQQEDLRALYCSADVFIFPSITEGFGWPPVEAMSCGCPVVSSIGGSLDEIVGDGAVRITDPMDAEAFANSAIEILKDGRAAAQWREKGWENALRFAESTLGPQLANLYSTLAQ